MDLIALPGLPAFGYQLIIQRPENKIPGIMMATEITKFLQFLGTDIHKTHDIIITIAALLATVQPADKFFKGGDGIVSSHVIKQFVPLI
jgi:hypothetical protein